MAMLKTTRTDASVEAFLSAIANDTRRQDCRTVLKIMKQATKAEPKMWGASIVGFGSYHYKYASGREGDWFLTGFSPRKTDLTLYIITGFTRYDRLMGKLGQYKTGKSCLYIKGLADIDLSVLKKLIEQSAKRVARASR